MAQESAVAAADAGVRLEVSAESAWDSGDPVLLERIAQNLVDNAIRYNADDGWVRISTSGADGLARLTVENTGPVVPAYEVPGLFELFRRLSGTERQADSAAGRGAGLGLSIVRSVATAHGGQARAPPRDDGGLVVEVRLLAAEFHTRPAPFVFCNAARAVAPHLRATSAAARVEPYVPV